MLLLVGGLVKIVNIIDFLHIEGRGVQSNSCDDGDTFKDQIKTGKLNMTDLYPNNNKEDFVKGEIKIGKLNTKVR